MSDQQINHPNKGLIHLILDGMPAWIRAIVFSILAFPLIVATSGMILQVNVGATIERVIDAQFEKQGIEQIEAQRAQLESMLQPLIASINKLDDDNKVIVSDVKTIDKRLTDVESSVIAIESWACDNKKTGPEPVGRPNFCK